MAKARRNIWAAAGITLGLLAGGSPAAAKPVVLHVTDFAGISKREWREAVDEANRIYKVAGIELVWEFGTTAIDSTAGRGLSVLLLNRDMSSKKIAAEGIPAGVLGNASHETARAYLFCERISAISAEKRRDFALVLGRALAHEIGHMLLPVPGHSSTGIMRAVLDLSNTPLRFTREQAAAMATSLGN